MKPCWILVALTLTLAGIGVACGPEAKFCGKENKPCNDIAAEMAQANARADAGSDVQAFQFTSK
jgi:hypothetical protein